jgi:serine/threonine protein phosphatase PrpC
MALDTLNEAVGAALPGNADDWTQALRDAFLKARECLREAAEKSATPVREYGTTLITVAVAQDWLAVGHIGDGAVVAALDDGTLETVSAPQRGEYANEVAPLTAPKSLEMVRFSVRQTSVKALALLTDGLQNLCINTATGRPYVPFFAPFFDAIAQEIDTLEVSRQLACFLDSESVCGKTDDDKTLLVVGRILHPDGSTGPLSNGGAT